MNLTDPEVFRESVAFAAGQSYERRRIGELIRQRISTVRQLQSTPVKPAIIRNVIGELERLAEAIEEV